MTENLFIKVNVYGNSMYPTLRNTDSVVVCKANEYVPDQIVVFIYKNEGYLIHRILCISKGRFFCKGDNSHRVEIIRKEHILGKVLFIKRGSQIIQL